MHVLDEEGHLSERRSRIFEGVEPAGSAPFVFQEGSSPLFSALMKAGVSPPPCIRMLAPDT